MQATDGVTFLHELVARQLKNPKLCTLYASQILCNLIEEILAPHSKLVWILDKWQDVLLMFLCVSFQKSGLNRGVHRLLPLFRLEVEPVGKNTSVL